LVLPQTVVEQVLVHVVTRLRHRIEPQHNSHAKVARLDLLLPLPAGGSPGSADGPGFATHVEDLPHEVR